MAYSKIRPRRDTLVGWQNTNPVLNEGEFVIEAPETGVGTGLIKVKIGDGFKRYMDLPYAFDGTAANAIYGGDPYEWHDIYIRTGTTAEWEDANPILGLGEITWDSDELRFKVGDGVHNWTDLKYIGGIDMDDPLEYEEDSKYDNMTEDEVMDVLKPGSTLQMILNAIKALFKKKATKNHASSTKDYGVGTTALFGHLKISDKTDGTNGVEQGVAASEKAVGDLNTKIDNTKTDLTNKINDLKTSKADKNHASSTKDYGVGTTALFGHLKISDKTDGTNGVEQGVAASEKAVGDLNTKIDNISTKVDNHTHKEYALRSIYADNSVNLGRLTESPIGNYSVALGNAVVASGNYSHAEGVYTTASGTESHAEGGNTLASSAQAHAEGRNTSATSLISHAEGENSITIGRASHAEGYYTTANESYSHSEGERCIAIGRASHAEGYNTKSGNGENSNSSTCASHAEGYGSNASGLATHAEGRNTKAIASMAHAEGGSTVASGQTSHAEGLYATASGEASHAEGSSTVSSANFSHAEGQSTKAMGARSHAEGEETIASGNASHAEGSGCLAQGTESHAEGFNTTALGNWSHAEGSSCFAKEAKSHAGGLCCTAAGVNSFVHGYNCATESYASDSIAMGYNCIAKTRDSVAMGFECETRTLIPSFAIGEHVIANETVNFVVGRYNNLTTTTGVKNFTVGCGNPSASTKNGFSVDVSGNIYCAGTLRESNSADYAEYFEWEDGNIDFEDRVGYFVTFDNNVTDKIRIANSNDEYILGIVSGQPAVLANADFDEWNGKILRDKFNRVIYERAPYIIYNEETREYDTQYDKDGNLLYKGVIPKINPDYNPDEPFVSRDDRPEWSPIGMLGVLSVRQDGTCIAGKYCTVNDNGIATICKDYNKMNKYRVVKVIDEEVVKVVFTIH